MEIHRPLFWHQGLFLQPQHFQLQDLSFDSRLIPFHKSLTPHFWGVSHLDIKKPALSLKSFGLASGKFLFPDGAYIEFPGNAVLEDRSFEDAPFEGGKPLTVYVGLKKWSSRDENVTVVKKKEALSEVTTRFVSRPEPDEHRDLHAGGPAGHVKKMDYFLKLFWEPEKENLGDYVLIPIAQVVRQGADFGLHPQFIPPCISLEGSSTLQKLVKEVSDQVLARSRELEEHKSQRGIHRAEFGSRDMVYLLALRSLNRTLPLLQHYTEIPQIHPWHIYGIFRQIIGDLSCFSEKINVFGEGKNEEDQTLPSYNPLALWNCFSIAQNLISRTLQEITAGPDHVVQLSPEDGIYTANLKTAMFEGNNRYFLALATEKDPKVVVSSMSKLAKVSSKQTLGRLISHALPGIPLEHLPTPPQELPRRGNVLYFSIDSHAKQWDSVKKEKNLSLSWDGAPESLQLELMVVSR